MEYNYPNKDLLEKRSSELEDEKKYYSLSKLIFKKDFDSKLLIPIGIGNENEKNYINLIDKSGILISGETGSGKSIFLNDIIISLLLKNSPEELQFIFIDPRNVEFNIYDEIPHVNKNIISGEKESIKALEYVARVIEERKEVFSKEKAKNINEYNEEHEVIVPQLLLIIDETTEIFEYEKSKELIKKILTDGYKFGIHLIIATSSHLKSNFDRETINMFSCILSFDLASEEQSKYLKINSANLLTVYGEALVKREDKGIIDIQVPYVSNHDIEAVVNYIKSANN